MSVNWDSLLWCVVGILGGAVVSAFFFLIGRKTKRIAFYKKSQKLFSKKMSSIKGLELSFKGKPVPNLVSSSIEIRNVGTDTIDSGDFARTMPLQISTDGTFLTYDTVDAFLTEITNPSSDISLQLIDSKTIRVDFDYLKPNDGVALTVLHTDNVKVNCELKRGKSFQTKEPIDSYKLSKWTNMSLPFIILVMSAAITLRTIFPSDKTIGTVVDCVTYSLIVASVLVPIVRYRKKILQEIKEKYVKE